MPHAAPHPCGHPGCSALTHGRRCDEHQREERRQLARSRPNPAAMGYGHEWRKASRRFLEENPLCVHCRQAGRIRTSEVTDHIVPHKGDMALFWNRSNWQALCWRCHSRKPRVRMEGGGRNDAYILSRGAPGACACKYLVLLDIDRARSAFLRCQN
ncbi:MAG: HNH endonuclease [Acidobacteriia bacterium]|nr:HNH endonuclease [Terriglobia bacterium]